MVPSYTPIATPVVPAPERQPLDCTRELARRPELTAPVTVITPTGDLELNAGSLLIGRLPECDVLLEDNLVSRMHARISVQSGSVVIEDLHSTNGVYVNGLRVGHSAALCEGDRILVGTTEISLFEYRDSSLTRIKAARVSSDALEDRPTPVAAVAPQTMTKPAPAASRGDAAKADLQVPSTARADALKVIGGLADRLAAAGNLEEAAQVLSGHLRRILKGANSGLVVPPEVASSASQHALTLARWTKQHLWADYVVELHLSARLVMTASTLVAFEDVISKLENFDHMLLSYYVDGLSERQEKLDLDERKRLERLKVLVKLAR